MTLLADCDCLYCYFFVFGLKYVISVYGWYVRIEVFMAIVFFPFISTCISVGNTNYVSLIE